MPAKVDRIHSVYDANIFAGNFLTKSRHSPNRQVFRRWLVTNEVQLIVSAEIIAEYLELFADHLGMPSADIAEWKNCFLHDPRTTIVVPGPRPRLCRDADDDKYLAAAIAGRARYLVTNDLDLLDLPVASRHRLPFQILTPARFLQEIDSNKP
jgi:putative PIN family toxin of toxin-antitoxin system